MNEIGVNIGGFQSTITNLRTSVFSLESSLKTNYTFNKTNIKPFVEDLENTIEAIELLQRYKKLLETDIDTLENVGETMKENDERIARLTNDMTGAKPINT
ncbi:MULTISPECIES: TIGR04197 family type VII secretion effector [unclassified Oceanobacillus]|uniref:TIGR04197 family type VII secretion effector n=1 Tax=unclassified Oceanobacillus TaxID=2630292 RepID=UPI001BECFDAE|nr:MULTISPECIES: TIGR04197 family type VII secretion effector [unclassified Oceanobacillus]MBT2598933.1 YwqI/YxiC family protein [Oceanobacillus sp. ISL-74]MBT2651852.1 YwqI/YxiC family protein [Oceanobacillus sp. ISL-73]